MPDTNAYRRSRPTGRSRVSREEPRSDAIVVALTAQVLICVLLLLTAVLVKKADEVRYESVRREYAILITEPAADGSGLAGLAEVGAGLQRVFASLEEFITSLVGRFAGGGEAIAGPDASEAPADSGESSQEEEAPGQSEVKFDYDYLGAAEMASALGRGGAYPVASATGSAPEGATFAQVLLTASVKPPVTGLITSDFSYRDHPVSGGSDFHTGMDIAAGEGRDILAALPGVVEEVGESDIYGNYIRLRHTGNLQTFYAHCSEILAEEGAQLRRGERIARVGQTGVTTGPHLHFSVIVDGQYTDPYWVLQDNIRLVDG